MEPSHYSYPYAKIAYEAGFDPKIFINCPILRPEHLYFYASLMMNTVNLPYNGDPISYLTNALKHNPSLISIFQTPINDLSHSGKLGYAHDTNKLYEPLIGKVVNSNISLTFVSQIFPLGSIDRHAYEYVYFTETSFEAKDDQLLYDLLTGDRSNSWLNLDLLELTDSHCNLQFVDAKHKICSSSRKRYESILMVIGSFKPQTKSKTKSVVRKALPKKLRMDLWEKHFPDQRKGRCFTCEAEIDIIAFEAGHIKPVAQGGSDTIDNLLPLCQACNRSMSATDMMDWAARYYPKAPALSMAGTLSMAGALTMTSSTPQRIVKVKNEVVSLPMFLADIMNDIKTQYPSPYQVYDRTFFVPGHGKIDVKKYRSKFGHWFNSLLPTIVGPDGVKYQFITDKDLFSVFPPGDVSPNENWKNIKKTEIKGKAIPVSWIYETDLKIFSNLKDYSMWGFINSDEFPYIAKENQKCGSAAVTKAYNSWLGILFKDNTIVNVLKYTPNEFVTAVNIGLGWNISYLDRNFIGMTKG